MPPKGDRADHWDWLLSDGAQLLSWACESEPRIGLVASAIQLPPHRMKYLDYEGPVSGDRGYVQIWARGTIEWIETGPDRFVAQVHSDRLNGMVEWVRRDGQNFRLSVGSVGSAGSDGSGNDPPGN